MLDYESHSCDFLTVNENFRLKLLTFEIIMVFACYCCLLNQGRCYLGVLGDGGMHRSSKKIAC